MAKSRARKKALTTEPQTTEAPITETAAPDVFDEQIEARKREAAQQQAAAVVHQTQEQERAAAHEHGHSHAARHTPPMTASGGPGTVREHGEHHKRAHRHHPEEGQSHADAVGKRPHYTGQGKIDLVVGAQLDEHQHPYFSIVRFKEKPSEKVREFLKQEAGFEWRQENEEWRRPIHFETRVQDRLNAERAFEEVCKMVRQERGITHDFGGAS